MNASPNLTFKQQRFVEEYQVDGNGSQAVLQAGYKTNYPAEMAYGLLRHPKIKHSLQSAQNARSKDLKIRVGQTINQYKKLKDKAFNASDCNTSLRALNQLVKHLKIFEHYHAVPLLEELEKNPDNLEELLNQFMWLNASLGNWSYVLRALELKVKLVGKERIDVNYEEILNTVS